MTPIDLFDMYANGASVKVLRENFVDMARSNDVEAVQRVWIRFPMAAWAYASQDLIEELTSLKAWSVLAAFAETKRIINPTSTPVKKDDPVKKDEVMKKEGREGRYQTRIILGFDEFDAANGLLQTMLSHLGSQPDMTDTSSATFQLRNMMCTLLEAVDSMVADRLLDILIENHGWNAVSSQFNGHVDTRKLETDVDTIIDVLFAI